MVEKLERVQAVSKVERVANSSMTPDADLRNELLKGLSPDQFGLSPDARSKVEWARALFELNYQVIRSVNSSQGYETTQEIFSFKGSYEFLQRASGGEWVSAAAEAPDAAAVEEAAEQDHLTQFQEYFSPENTTQRILDVALSFFAAGETDQGEGNIEAVRQKFADFIGAAIDEGFRQARDILGDLSEDVSVGFDKTHALVFSGLTDFVKNGIDPEKSRPGGVFEKIAAFREETKAHLTSNFRSSSTVSYDSSGESHNAPANTPNISTKG